jgi:hypothetical protein
MCVFYSTPKNLDYFVLSTRLFVCLSFSIKLKISSQSQLSNINLNILFRFITIFRVKNNQTDLCCFIFPIRNQPVFRWRFSLLFFLLILLKLNKQNRRMVIDNWQLIRFVIDGRKWPLFRAETQLKLKTKITNKQTNSLNS